MAILVLDRNFVVFQSTAVFVSFPCVTRLSLFLFLSPVLFSHRPHLISISPAIDGHFWRLMAYGIRGALNVASYPAVPSLRPARSVVSASLSLVFRSLVYLLTLPSFPSHSSSPGQLLRLLVSSLAVHSPPPPSVPPFRPVRRSVVASAAATNHLPNSARPLGPGGGRGRFFPLLLVSPTFLR